jgi:hypothetical protein
MKRSNLLKAFLLIAFVSIILPACKKDKNNKYSCTIVAEVQYSASSTNTVNNKVAYNDVDATVSYKLEDGRIYTWHYPGSITIMGEAGENWYQKTITLNEYGMLTNFRTDDDASGDNWTIDQYSYQNGVQLIFSSHIPRHQPPFSRAYTWANGNLITMTDQASSQSKETFSYSANRASAPGDYFTHLNIIYYQGFRVLGSKNLPVSDQYSNILNVIAKVLFAYQYDKDGKIKTMTISNEAGQFSKIDYVYQCSEDNYSK